MKKPSTRIALLIMGAISTVIFGVGYATGSKPDDALLVFAGSMFTTYALTEPRKEEKPPPPPPPEEPREIDAGQTGGSR